MKKAVKFVSFMLAGAMMFSLSACAGGETDETSKPEAAVEESSSSEVTDESSSSGETAETSESSDVKQPEDMKFGLAIHFLFDDWGKACAEAFEDRCEELGITVEVLNGENDPEKQLNDVQSFYARGFDAIAINPVDTKALASIGTELYEEGIPFVSVAPNDDYPYYGYVDGGQWDKANASAEMMVEDLGGEGKIIAFMFGQRELYSH